MLTRLLYVWLISSYCQLSVKQLHYVSQCLSLLWPHHIVRCQSPEEFSLVFPLNTVHVLDFSIFSSLSLLSGYGACVPTTPKVPAVPQHKLGTQASGAFSGEKSTSLPSLLPYKVLWHPLRGNAQAWDETHLDADTEPVFDVAFQVKTGGKMFISCWKRTMKNQVWCTKEWALSSHIYYFLDQKWNQTLYQNMLVMGEMRWKR